MFWAMRQQFGQHLPDARSSIGDVGHSHDLPDRRFPKARHRETVRSGPSARHVIVRFSSVPAVAPGYAAVVTLVTPTIGVSKTRHSACGGDLRDAAYAVAVRAVLWQSSAPLSASMRSSQVASVHVNANAPRPHFGGGPGGITRPLLYWRALSLALLAAAWRRLSLG